MTERVPFRPGLRFQILKRDRFKCRYCGADGSEAKLHIDHVQPVVRGGTNHHLNLVTACAQCNRSKKDQEWEWSLCSPLLDVNGVVATEDLRPGEGHLMDLQGAREQWFFFDLTDEFEAAVGRQPTRDEFQTIGASSSAEVAIRFGPECLGRETCIAEPEPEPGRTVTLPEMQAARVSWYARKKNEKASA